MQKVSPCLWFDTQGEEAARYYTSIFPNSRIIEVSPGPDGNALTVTFELEGQVVTILNGGPAFQLNESFSLMVSCRDQAEVDELWSKLTDGGQESQCGWLKDRFGVSWQILPTRLMELLSDPDPGRAQRATQAMLGMRKIDVAQLERAAAAQEVSAEP